MRRAGALAKLEEPHSYLEQTSSALARAVVGHDLIRSVGDVYRDLSQPHLARIAIGYAWNELRYHEPRLGPSPPAIDDACGRVELLIDTLEASARELEAVEQRQARLNELQSRLTREERELAVLESNTLVFGLARLQQEIATVAGRLEDARVDLDEVLVAEVEIELGEEVYGGALERAQQRG